MPILAQKIFSNPVQAKSIWPRLMLNAVRAGSELVNLLPSNTARWWPLVEDVFSSPNCLALRDDLLQSCLHHNEFRSLSVDGTFRVCLPILGQRPFNLSKSERAEAAIPEEESFRRVITVRGKTGAVVTMFPSYGEGAIDIRKGLIESLPGDALKQVEFLATDAPSKRLYEALKEALPNLHALALDPVHLAMHYESASSRHKTVGSAALRRGLAKFSCCPGSSMKDNLGDFFTGELMVRLSTREMTLRSQILDGSMGKFKAQRLLTNSDPSSSWVCRADFIEFLAALSAVYRSETAKKTDDGKTLAHLLHQATDGERLEWLFNNIRIRARFSVAEKILLPVGTTSNESLHAEINGWFRQTQSIHQSTLKLKLGILTLSKLLSHNAALYSPAARQMMSSQVLARRIGNGLWSKDEWNAWAHRSSEKAQLPVEKTRQGEASRLKRFLAKKPAVLCKRPAAKGHKTPFNLTRSKGIRRAGVHSRPTASQAKAKCDAEACEI